jgi:hypothetical protein
MITNETFDAYWNNDDNQALMNKACSNFAINVDDWEIENCKMHAMFRVLRSKTVTEQNFNSALYSNVIWELRRYYKQTKPLYSNPKHQKYIDVKNGEAEKRLGDKLSDPEKQMIVKDVDPMVKDRYLGNMTWQQLGDKYGK